MRRTGARVVPRSRPPMPAAMTVTEARPNSRRGTVSLTSAPREAVTVGGEPPARQEALDRGQPLALIAECEVPVHEQRAGRGGHQDERDRRHSDEDKTHGVGWEAIDSCLRAALDELPRQIRPPRGEHKADDRRRREEVGETRDPCDRESPGVAR